MEYHSLHAQGPRLLQSAESLLHRTLVLQTEFLQAFRWILHFQQEPKVM